MEIASSPYLMSGWVLVPKNRQQRRLGTSIQSH